MRNDKRAESKHIYACLNSARPSELKVVVDDPLKQQSVPSAAIKEVAQLSMEEAQVAPCSVVISTRQTRKPILPIHDMHNSMSPIGGTQNPLFPVIPPHFSYMPVLVRLQATKLIIYQGNVTINNYYIRSTPANRPKIMLYHNIYIILR